MAIINPHVGLLVSLCLSISGAAGQCNYGSGCFYGCFCYYGCDQWTGACQSGGCRPDDPTGAGLLRTGAGCVIGNVAKKKAASQSGQVGSYRAGLAVDGSLSTSWCAVPDAGSGNRAWWYVDLEDSYTVVSVTIFNTTNTKEYARTGDFRVGVGYVTDGDSTAYCTLFTSNVPRGGQLTIYCSSPVSGRYVTIIRKQGSYQAQYLGLCEVMVHGYKPTGCDAYHYGDSCAVECSSSCQWSGSRQCYSTDGTCIQCSTGRWGTKCDKTCTNCQNNLCDIGSGACTLGCVNVYYGDKCSLECSVRCLNTECSGSGKCTQGCVSGYYGVSCSSQCSSRCLYDVSGNNTCHRDTGVCSNGCQHGYYGQKCTSPCSGNCAEINDIPVCDRDSGGCPLGCQDGRYGEVCDETCNAGCKPLQEGLPGACNQSSGSCAHGCKDGFYGEICNELCSSQCSGENGVPTCDRYNGLCSCQIGYYGENCNKTCGSHCETAYNTHTCEKDSGVCSHGCRLPDYDTWYAGDYCDRPIEHLSYPVNGSIEIINVSPSSITVGWTHTVTISETSQEFYGYRVYAIRGSQKTYDDHVIDSEDQFKAYRQTLTGLLPNTRYDVKVTLFRSLPNGKTEESQESSTIVSVTTLAAETKSPSALSPGSVAGIVIAAAVLSTALALLIGWCVIKEKRKTAAEAEPVQDNAAVTQPTAGLESVQPLDSGVYVKPLSEEGGYENLTGDGDPMYEQLNKNDEYEEINLDFQSEQ